MGKTSLNKKAVKKAIIDGRKNGLSDQEIYNQQAQQYSDKKTIAILISTTPTDAEKEKYRTLNTILLVLIGLTIILKILAVVSMSAETSEPSLLLFVFVAPIINILFFFAIATFQVTIYRICGILSLLGIVQGLRFLESPVEMVISIVLSAAIAGLSFYLDSKLFSPHSPKKLQQDSNGDYILADRLVMA